MEMEKEEPTTRNGWTGRTYSRVRTKKTALEQEKTALEEYLTSFLSDINAYIAVDNPSTTTTLKYLIKNWMTLWIPVRVIIYRMTLNVMKMTTSLLVLLVVVIVKN